MSESESDTISDGEFTNSKVSEPKKYKRGQKKMCAELSSDGMRQRFYRLQTKKRMMSHSPVHIPSSNKDPSFSYNKFIKVTLSDHDDSFANIQNFEDTAASRVPSQVLETIVSEDDSFNLDLDDITTLLPSQTLSDVSNTSHYNLENTTNTCSDSIDENLFIPNENPLVTDYIIKTLNRIVTQNSLSRKPINQILALLQPFFPNLPKDGRTLRQTPRLIQPTVVAPGSYVHIGIEKYLNTLLREQAVEAATVLLDVFVDGVAFHNIAKKKSFWVILGRFEVSQKVFLIGVYNGVSQPTNFNKLLDELIKEALHLRENGYQFNNKTYYLELNNFIGDSIAQADVFFFKHPTGRFSCPYCKAEGERVENRMVFLSHNDEKRTDNDFKNQVDQNHHTGTSALSTYLLPFPSHSPIDYMHTVLLGATKRFLSFLFGKSGKRGLLRIEESLEITKHLNKINKAIPSEIHHECRSIKDIATYKASHFRVLLLKVGPSIFKTISFPGVYKTFLLLHASISILCDPETCITLNELAKEMLKDFIDSSIDIFGSKFAVSVIHRLVHLPDIVKKQNKPLDSFSSFPFESFIAEIKRDIHSPKEVLKQLFNRRYETFKAKNKYFLNLEKQTPITIQLGKKAKSTENYYNSIKIADFIIKPNCLRNGFILGKSKKIFFCKNIQLVNDNIYLSCIEMINKEPLFTHPINAFNLNYFSCESKAYNELLSTSDNASTSLRINELERKMFFIPHDNETFVFAPFKKFQ